MFLVEVPFLVQTEHITGFLAAEIILDYLPVTFILVCDSYAFDTDVKNFLFLLIYIFSYSSFSKYDFLRSACVHWGPAIASDRKHTSALTAGQGLSSRQTTVSLVQV